MTATLNRGFQQAESSNPDYASGGAWARLDAALVAIDAVLGLEVHAASGVIAIKEGVVLLKGTGACLMTLATPVAGPASAGGDDGKCLKIIAATAHAHTVTTAGSKINSADDTVTYAAVGDWAELVAYNGIWYANVSGPTPATLSEA